MGTYLPVKNIYHRMTGQVNKTYEGEIIMNIKSATAARLLTVVAQLTHISHVYPCQPWYLSNFPHGNAVMFGAVQTAKMVPLSQKKSYFIVPFMFSPNLAIVLPLALLRLEQNSSHVGSQDI